MSRTWRWLGLVALAGCSDITAGKNGVVALELRIPSPPAVEANDTLALHARALDAHGDSVAIPVLWRTLDDSLLTIVDSTGLVTTSVASGNPRVQAFVGSLSSELVTLTIRPSSDTLVLTVPDSITVPSSDSLTDTLGAAVLSNNPAGGVSGTSILYEVLDTLAAAGKLQFSSGLLVLRAATGIDGSPASAVTLRKVAGTTPPPSIQVRVSAVRPSNRPVPGSGQLFTILFQ
jgi:hypothetical protein